MTVPQINQAKVFIKNNYPDKEVELLDELDRYVSSNSARNSNRMTFVNLAPELRTTIAKTKGIGKGKLVR